MNKYFPAELILAMGIGGIVLLILSTLVLIALIAKIVKYRHARADVDRLAIAGRIWIDIGIISLGYAGVCILTGFLLLRTPIAATVLFIIAGVLAVSAFIAYWKTTRTSERLWLADIADRRLWRMIEGNREAK
jgi:hypothetical protein